MLSALNIQKSIAIALQMVVAITSGTLVANASGDGVSNGGFENGDLSGWTAVGSAVVVHYVSHSGNHEVTIGRDELA